MEEERQRGDCCILFTCRPFSPESDARRSARCSLPHHPHHNTVKDPRKVVQRRERACSYSFWAFISARAHTVPGDAPRSLLPTRLNHAVCASRRSGRYQPALAAAAADAVFLAARPPPTLQSLATNTATNTMLAHVRHMCTSRPTVWRLDLPSMRIVPRDSLAQHAYLLSVGYRLTYSARRQAAAPATQPGPPAYALGAPLDARHCAPPSRRRHPPRPFPSALTDSHSPLRPTSLSGEHLDGV